MLGCIPPQLAPFYEVQGDLSTWAQDLALCRTRYGSTQFISSIFRQKPVIRRYRRGISMIFYRLGPWILAKNGFTRVGANARTFIARYIP